MNLWVILSILLFFCQICFVKLAGLKKRKVSLPKPELCQGRKAHLRNKKTNYFFSWRHELKKDWLGSRNYCRERCMDLVSFETEAEWNLISNAVKNELDRTFPEYVFWTGGRLCDFKLCKEKNDKQELWSHEWFWVSTLKYLDPATCIPDRRNCFHAWSNNGKYGFPQPDNREFREVGDYLANESCIAAMKAYNRSLGWHDKACYHKALFICEDSSSLIDYAKFLLKQQKKSSN